MHYQSLGRGTTMGAKLLLVVFLVITTAGHPIWAQEGITQETADLVQQTIEAGLQTLSGTVKAGLAATATTVRALLLDGVIG
ncbi:hypothetical protein BDA96_05G141200 [Sorghum bicolor]|uniref:Uncharacterized protein n=2 Tax=Sorghum bicolor TaxID=4558 RepID=A0A921UGK2_SORBI|nr:hypothetical protein BDA96_05G141200 [Sorghum bicolor]KXG28494.1 hypothetical protein SORBI_3005G129000 [Sorghum bicolor]